MEIPRAIIPVSLAPNSTPETQTHEAPGHTPRALRNTCDREDTTTQRRQIFDLLHARYPNSEWAHRYPKFNDDSNQ